MNALSTPPTKTPEPAQTGLDGSGLSDPNGAPAAGRGGPESSRGEGSGPAERAKLAESTLPSLWSCSICRHVGPAGDFVASNIVDYLTLCTSCAMKERRNL